MPLRDAPITWCLSSGFLADHALAIVLALAVTVFGFLAGWIARPIIGEYAKIWHFFGVPPWRYKPTTLSELKRGEAALKAREQEIAASMAAFDAMMDRAERIEAAYIALLAERSDWQNSNAA